MTWKILCYPINQRLSIKQEHFIICHWLRKTGTTPGFFSTVSPGCKRVRALLSIPLTLTSNDFVNFLTEKIVTISFLFLFCFLHLCHRLSTTTLIAADIYLNYFSLIDLSELTLIEFTLLYWLLWPLTVHSSLCLFC